MGQVNLLDPDGRTVYTRHVHAHEDKSLWLNPAFGALDMLDKTVTRVAEFIAKDAEFRRLATVHARHRTNVASRRFPSRRDQPTAAAPASGAMPGEEAMIAPQLIRALPGKDQAP